MRPREIDVAVGRTNLALLLVVAALATTPIPVAGAGAGEAAAPKAADVSSTPIGRELAKEAAEHRMRLGAPAQGLRVLHDAAGYLVVPTSTRVTLSSSTTESGQTVASYAPIVEAPESALLKTADMSPMVSASWTFIYSNCYARISDSWSWMDHCTQIFQLSNDGDGSRDYFALKHYATAAGNWPWFLWWGKISSSPIVTGNYGAQTWVDWSPRSDYTGGCRSTTISVTAVFATLQSSVDECENWHFTKGNPAVTYSLQGNWHIQWDRNRELAYEIAVSVAQGKSVAWSVPAEVHGGIVQ